MLRGSWNIDEMELVLQEDFWYHEKENEIRRVEMIRCVIGDGKKKYLMLLSDMHCFLSKQADLDGSLPQLQMVSCMSFPMHRLSHYLFCASSAPKKRWRGDCSVECRRGHLRKSFRTYVSIVARVLFPAFCRADGHRCPEPHKFCEGKRLWG